MSADRTLMKRFFTEMAELCVAEPQSYKPTNRWAWTHAQAGAVGYFYLDTREYLNGVHTIAWSVQDNAGNQDGVGSRYFTIVNIGRDGTAGTNSNDNQLSRPHYFSVSQVHQATLSVEPVFVKKGYDRNSPWQIFYPDSSGIITVGLKEDERIEMLISPGAYTYGYMMVGEQRRLLPLGSTLESANGIFYWQVGPAFFGQHQLVFVEKVGNSQFKKKIIKVMISSKY